MKELMDKLLPTAKRIRDGEVLAIPSGELAEMLEKAYEQLDGSAKAVAMILHELMVQKLAESIQPPRQARMIELTKEVYVAYCKHRITNETKGLMDLRNALRGANSTLGVTKVVELEEGPDLLKHLQTMDKLVENWASDFADFALKAQNPEPVAGG